MQGVCRDQKGSLPGIIPKNFYEKIISASSSDLPCIY